jgi:hypothetical protein
LVCPSLSPLEGIFSDIFLVFLSPGRFFAANELKAMLSHVVLNYDVKLEHEGVRPANTWFATACVPNPTAEVMFRKRESLH